MIKDLADFRVFLTICRQKGVTKVSTGGLTVEFGELPTRKRQAEDTDEVSHAVPTDEDLALWSVGVHQP